MVVYQQRHDKEHGGKTELDHEAADLTSRLIPRCTIETEFFTQFGNRGKAWPYQKGETGDGVECKHARHDLVVDMLEPSSRRTKKDQTDHGRLHPEQTNKRTGEETKQRKVRL